MTTQQHAGGIPVPGDAWIQGGSQTNSYLSVVYETIEDRALDQQQETISASLVAEAVAELHRYTLAPAN
ncbi:hypothetical protein Harman_04160 [Haloarcula mannanilytica]|uniref:Uncharacterized protein n=1 Tax=Haloarcula mannanilytica TaxID=2509225 RepID=A0A4C2ED83_9EURY|nr:hypothetical protein Harman_04160 [Haloarcula mannanilytica]